MFLLKYYLNHKKDMNYYQSNLLASLMHLVYHFVGVLKPEIYTK